jgi:valyl-tRNA synthetase
MPFVTEELWQNLPPDKDRAESLMVAPYPHAVREAFDLQAEREMESIIEIIRSLRNARTEHKIEPSQWIEAQIYAEHKPRVESHAQAIENLARVRPLTILERERSKITTDKALAIVLADAELVLPIAGMVELEVQRQRWEKEIAHCQAEITHLESQLKDSTFLSKAPSFVVEREQEKLSRLQSKLEKLKEKQDLYTKT